MSFIWFRSCNTATQFCEGRIICGFCTNISQCVILKKWRSLGRLEEIDQEGLISPLFSWINGTFLDLSPILCLPIPVFSCVLWGAQIFSLIWSWPAVKVRTQVFLTGHLHDAEGSCRWMFLTLFISVVKVKKAQVIQGRRPTSRSLQEA